jgi:uncharacterized protein (UPF0276 family)
MAHSEYAEDVIRHAPGLVDYVEVPVERLIHDPETIKLRSLVSLVLHCSSLSIAGTVPPTSNTVREIDRWARETATPWIGEHLAFVTARGKREVTDVGFTVSPVMNDETAERVVTAVRKWRDIFGLPLLLENSPLYFDLPGGTMDQPTLFRQVCAASPAGVLLDITHLLVTARNLGLNATAFLESFPLDRVVEVHVSGLTCQSGVWWDDHAHPAPEEVFALLGHVVKSAPALRAVTLEYNWDPMFPQPLLRSHVDRIRLTCDRR